MGQWQPHRLSRHWGHWPLVCPSVAILLFLAQLARSAPIDLVSYSGHTRPVQWGAEQTLIELLLPRPLICVAHTQVSPERPD